MIATPHINPTADIAETILLPGDPLRAKFIAENFFENPVQFNTVRNALGFTGYYKGKQISVMGTGMGMPSIGIYSHELISVYGCKNLIRVGSCGALQDELNIYDVIIGMAASTNSDYQKQFLLPGTFAPCASWKLLKAACDAANTLEIPVNVGNILSSDIFYDDRENVNDAWKKMGVLGIEMEAAALYMNGNRLGANALCILTVSDHIYKKTATTAEERETSFTQMMKIALETSCLL